MRYIFIQKILIEYFKDSKAFTENLSDTKDVNPNVYDYNPKWKHKTIAFDELITDMLSNGSRNQ